MKDIELFKLQQDRILQVLGIHSHSPLGIEINTREAIIFTYSSEFPVWKLNNYKDFLIRQELYLQNRLSIDGETRYIKEFLQPTLKIEKDLSELVILKWNRAAPYIYSDKLENDTIIVISSEFSGRVGFARALVEQELHDFVKRFFLKEKEFRQEFGNFESKLDTQELQKLQYKFPKIFVSASFQDERDTTTKQYMKYFWNCVNEHLKDTKLQVEPQFLWSYKEISQDMMYFSLGKRHFVPEKNLSLLQYKGYTIDNLFNNPLSVENEIYKKKCYNMSGNTENNIQDIEKHDQKEMTQQNSKWKCTIFSNPSTSYSIPLLNYPSIIHTFFLKHGSKLTSSLIDLLSILKEEGYDTEINEMLVAVGNKGNNNIDDNNILLSSINTNDIINALELLTGVDSICGYEDVC